MKKLVVLTALLVMDSITFAESFQEAVARYEYVQNEADYMLYKTKSATWSDEEIGALIACYSFCYQAFEDVANRGPGLSEQDRHKYRLFSLTCKMQHDNLFSKAEQFSAYTRQRISASLDKWYKHLCDGGSITFNRR